MRSFLALLYAIAAACWAGLPARISVAIFFRMVFFDRPDLSGISHRLPLIPSEQFSGIIGKPLQQRHRCPDTAASVKYFKITHKPETTVFHAWEYIIMHVRKGAKVDEDRKMQGTPCRVLKREASNQIAVWQCAKFACDHIRGSHRN